MTQRIFIDGAAGTTGLEIRERLAGRDEFELIVLGDEERKSESARRDALHAADIAILCLPDDAAKESVSLAEGSDTRFIDASSAHRVADGWTYGFPELIGHDTIANAQFVSNPGCYPTGFLALVAPLVKAGLLPADWPYTVNAVSGYSGGGKALIERFAQETDFAFRAYGLGGGHKHLPEMKAYAGLTHAPVFSPSVVPAHRGMIVDVPLTLAAMEQSHSPAALLNELQRFYDGSDLVSVHGDVPGELLLHEGAPAWDGIELWVCGDAAGAQVRLVARLDNLGKGASGAAIQNLNIMCGLPETTGLRLG
ncbi:N-acetyl-gamma-glutamyl-phosphate reductase [Altererythrobacter epoxidivorans]|uniref:N-acetyl-gamma-glutamyl-phosphate reductase n=1 Tax=Altererythrobacter epoxidivorans TaxID=361183 RepID=A0A0M4M5A4_9SPHN|nr:N-acetyl-gamma-glutamyl-phosphate reductase [Altererythrobacter epoxidivorans]ALE17178.1 N-acetyl-gamma-glutamyl-phosphate reductase [Altererythrobacter epoxidivorans]